jgi:Tfp pilus assembly protein PilF
MQNLIEQGLQAYENKDFDTAATLLEQAIVVCSDTTERERLRIKLASAHDEMQRYPQALETLKAALEDNPSSSAAWNNIGVVCQRIGKLDDARQAFERAYTLDPENAEHLINLGSTCLKLSDPGNALQYLQLAIELVPGHPVAHANLALTYGVFGRLEEAEDSLRLAVLYGFEQGEVMQQKIDALKQLRDKIRQDAANRRDSGEEKDETSQQAGGEMDVLVQLEKEIFALAEKYFGAEELAEEDRLKSEARLQDLRKTIRVLRRKLGMEEVSESDIAMGVNYMRDDNGETG